MPTGLSMNSRLASFAHVCLRRFQPISYGPISCACSNPITMPVVQYKGAKRMLPLDAAEGPTMKLPKPLPLAPGPPCSQMMSGSSKIDMW